MWVQPPPPFVLPAGRRGVLALRDFVHVCVMRSAHSFKHTYIHTNFTSVNPLNSHLDATQTFQLFHSSACPLVLLRPQSSGVPVPLIAGMLEISTTSQSDSEDDNSYVQILYLSLVVGCRTLQTFDTTLDHIRVSSLTLSTCLALIENFQNNVHHFGNLILWLY